MRPLGVPEAVRAEVQLGFHRQYTVRTILAHLGQLWHLTPPLASLLAQHLSLCPVSDARWRNKRAFQNRCLLLLILDMGEPRIVV